MVARMATLGQRVGGALSFEISAGHVIDQKLMGGGEQHTDPLLQVFVDDFLVR